MSSEFEVSFKVDGLSALNKTLTKLESRVQRRISLKALKAGARITRDKAKMLAPSRKGVLKRSLTVVARKRHGSVNRVLVVPAKGKNRKNDAYYAHFIEFGTQAHAIGQGSDLSRGKQKGRVVSGIKPHPFLIPAAEMTAPRVIKEVGDVLMDEITKAFARGD